MVSEQHKDYESPITPSRADDKRFRDQELRFTVHESPDYYQLKVSIFNDDKKTELIGETWIDLKNVIVEGGGQNDVWHGLQCRGKYSGDIRIELTYYDTRPKSEVAVERRKEVEKVEAKSSSPAAHTLSGPRQPKPVKRRPLPVDPTGSSSSRPAAPSEQAPPAQARDYPHPPPTRPAISDGTRPSSRSSGAPGPHMRPLAHDHPHQAPPSNGKRFYDAPNNVNRPRTSTNSSHHTNNAVPHQPYPRDNRGSFREEPAEMYDSRPQQVIPPADSARYSQSYSQQQLEFVGGHQPGDYGHPQDARADVHGHVHGHSMDHSMPYSRNPYETPPRQSVQNATTPDQHRSGAYHPHSQRSRNSPYTTPNAYGSSPQDVPQARSAPGSGDRNGHYHRYSTSPSKNDVFRDSPLRNAVSRADFQSSYAPMQPPFDDDEGPPPPPPAHREGVVQSSHHQNLYNGTRPVPIPETIDQSPVRALGNSPGRQPQSYVPYQADARSASPSTEMDPSYRGYSASSQTSYSQPRYPSQDLVDSSNEATVPPSLVAGYDPVIADAESERMIHENNADKRRSHVPMPTATSAQPIQPRHPGPPAYHVAPENGKPPPPTVEDAEPQDTSMALTKRRSVSPDIRSVPARKSVSPRPSVSPQPGPTEERVLSGIPFSPDSFDALNPNIGSASSVQPQGAPYDTPEQAMEAARQREVDKLRDVGPIIGNDGRVIDPTDHLPTDTWAPEPDRKARKPEVVVRFKNAPQSNKTSHARDSEAQRPQPKTTPSHASHRHSVGPQLADPNSSALSSGRNRLQKQSGRRNSYIPPHVSDAAISPPRSNNALRERENFAAYDNNSNRRSTSPYYSPQQNSRPTTSSSHSPSSVSFYHSSHTGPPIPAKVPIHPGNQNYPGSYSGGGADPLSEEMRRIDIGTVGSRPASGGGRVMRRPM